MNRLGPRFQLHHLLLYPEPPIHLTSRVSAVISKTIWHRGAQSGNSINANSFSHPVAESARTSLQYLLQGKGPLGSPRLGCGVQFFIKRYEEHRNGKAGIKERRVGLPLSFLLQSHTNMMVGNSTSNMSKTTAALVRCKLPFEKCLRQHSFWQPFFFFFLIKAKISLKKHIVKEAKGMLVPVSRSHIYLFLVPSKAQYTVISIITYCLS